jgi:hypothetical protein
MPAAADLGHPEWHDIQDGEHHNHDVEDYGERGSSYQAFE